LGKSNYKFRAIFPTVKEAKWGEKVLLKYMQDQTLAYEMWQERLSHKDSYQFYLQIKRKYPFAFYLFREKKYPIATLATLAHALTNFRGEESYIPLRRRENEVNLCILLTWHFDNWNHLVTLARLLGASAGYLNTEFEVVWAMLPPLEYKIKLSPKLEENLERIKQALLFKNL